MTIALLAVLFAVDLILFFYFKREIKKIKLLLEKPKAEEPGDKIPMDEQWSNFLSYNGRGK